jgi:hypothetical protein
LLVEPDSKINPQYNVSNTPAANQANAAGSEPVVVGELPVRTLGVTGSDQAIIGGGCCVQLSVEYMPAQPVVNVDSSTQECGVTVEVADNEGCLLVWRKAFMEGYHVKESIITTYPGAWLTVKVSNAIARVRWCETFSC